MAMKKDSQETPGSFDKSFQCLQDAKDIVKDIPTNDLAFKPADQDTGAHDSTLSNAITPFRAPVTPHVPPKVESVPSSVKRPEPTTASLDFQYQVLENIVHDSLDSFAQELKQDIQDMHVELLRQFQSQKVKNVKLTIRKN